jgi:hypothetical protein
MKKKILLVSILATFMLVAISYATAVNTTNSVDKKESPLYGIRTRRAIEEKISKIVENIKTNFIGERIFFLPFYRTTYYDNSPDDRRDEPAKCWGGYTDVFKGRFCSYGNSPAWTCIYSVGTCCPTGAK